MKIALFLRSFAATAIVALLASGCAGSRAASTASSVIPQAEMLRTGRGWIKPGTSAGPLLYAVGDDGNGFATLIYSYPAGQFVGSLDIAGGLCSDTQGNVFVVSRDAATEYAHGGTTPIQTLRIPGAEMFACSVDPTTNDLAVIYSCPPCGYQDLAVFPNESGPAVRYHTGNDASTCAYDGSGNLFVNDSLGVALRELPRGSGYFTTVTFDKNVGDINQIQWDGSHMTLQQASYPGGIYRFEVVGSTGKILTATTFKKKIYWNGPSWIYSRTVVFAFNPKPDSEPPAEIGIWKYPQGRRPIHIIGKAASRGYDFASVTVSAPPSLR
jgi:hypothetical protein